MRTLRILTAISLALILSGWNAAYSRQLNNPGNKIPATMGIRYEVNIHFKEDIQLCDVYIVQMVDGQGRLVAPVQHFRPGVYSYSFYETGSVRGTRVARLVLDTSKNHNVCPFHIYALPDVRTGTFLSGRTYTFDLYPATAGIK